MQKIQLGYLGIQAKGQVSRLLLTYTNQQFQDVIYSYPQFFARKQSIGLQFPNLPYLIDGKFKISQHTAIERYIILKSKKKSLLGVNSKQKGIIDNIKGVLLDVNNILIPTVLNPTFRQIRKDNYEKLKPKLEYIQRFIRNKQFLLNTISYVDFHLAIFFSYFKVAYPEQAKKYTNIIRITDHFYSLPEIKKYYDLPNAITALFPQKFNKQIFDNLGSVQQIQKSSVKQQPVEQPFKQQPVKQLIKQQQVQQPIKQQQVEQPIKQQAIKQPVKQQQRKQVEQVKQKPQIPFQSTKKKQTQASSSQKTQQVKQRTQKPIQAKLKQYLKKVQNTNSKTSGPLLHQKNSGQVIKPSEIKFKQTSMPWLNQQKQQQKSNKNILVFGRQANESLAQLLLLELLNVTYKDVVYESQQIFNRDSQKLGLDFSALPYLIDDDLKITSGLAIDRYLIAKVGNQTLLGKDLADNARQQNLTKLVYDLMRELRAKVKSCTSEQWKSTQGSKFYGKIQQRLNQIKASIGNKTLSMGYLTFADLILTQFSFQIKKHFQSQYKQLEFFQLVKNQIRKKQKLAKFIQ